jgi:hypothetical protein
MATLSSVENEVYIYTYIHASAFQSIHKCAISTEYNTCKKSQDNHKQDHKDINLTIVKV